MTFLHYQILGKTQNDIFEYIIEVLLEKSSLSVENNDFSIIKTHKLFFFIYSLDLIREKRLMDLFKEFYALPYGPVEMDIYNSMLNDRLSKFIINREGLKLKNRNYIFSIDSNLKNYINNLINQLLQINSNILEYKAFQLVEITHHWKAWIKNFHIARVNSSLKHKISDQDIIESNKPYSY